MDLANDDDIRATVEKTVEAFGGVDILVNNAMYVASRVKFLGSNTEILDMSYRVNVHAPYLLSLLVAPIMEARGGGSIVNISSGAARHPEPPFAPQPTFEPQMSPSYGITKAALNRIGTAYAGELLASGISLITVVPGLTVTERIERNPLRPGVDLSKADSPDVTAKAVAFVLRDPPAYAGHILQATQLVEKNDV
jgi:NAD(P)-dependent dehydrogenase (short-subunit alcohol dehydrogenase family)